MTDEQLNPKVLGQLLLMQSYINSLPDKETIFGFVCKELLDIPGIAKVEYFESHPKGLKNKPLSVCLPVERGESYFGEIVLQLSDLALYKPYESYLSNFIFMIGLVLEERHQRQLNEQYILLLEQRITERTHEIKEKSEEIEAQNEEYQQINEGLNQINTELKKAGERVEEDEMKLSAITNQSVDGIALSDMNGNYVFVNPAFCKMTGYSSEELLKMTVFDLCANSKPEGVFNESKENKTGIPNQVKIKRKDNSEFNAEIIGNVIKLNEQNFLLGTVRDITEHNQTEVALLRTQYSVDNMTDSIFWVDKSANIVFANQTACRNLGYSMEELLTLKVFDIDNTFPKDSWDIHWNEILNKGSFTLESAFRTKSGREYQVEVTTNKVEYGGIIYNCAIARDITERKQIENILQFIAQKEWTTNTENFSNALVKYLGNLLDVDYVFINVLSKEIECTETVALFAKGNIVPNIKYSLHGTPCEKVIGEKLCYYDKNIQQLFPTDALLVEMKAESYAGIPIWNSAGKPVGLIAIMDSKPFANKDTITNAIQIVAPRVAAELEREKNTLLLKESEKKYRTLAETIPDNIIRYDKNGRVIYMNTKIQETINTKFADFKNLLPTDRNREYLPLGAYNEYDQNLFNVLSTGKTIEFEFLVPDLLPKKEIHLLKIVPEYNENGEIIGAITIGRDITERKQAEEALREAEWRYREIFDNVLDGISLLEVLANGSFRTIEVNPALEKITGIPRSFSIGKTQEETVPPEVAEDVNISYRRCIETGHPIAGEKELDLPSGKRYFHSTLIPARDQNGNIYHIIGISRDITEQKLAEIEILKLKGLAEKNQKLLIDMMNNSSSYMYMLDIEGKFISINQSLANFLGKPINEIIGNAREKFMPSEIAEQHYNNDKIVIEKRTTLTFEEETIKEGEKQYYFTTKFPLIDNQNTLYGIAGISTDITERKKTEEAVLNINRKLKAISNCNQALLHCDDEQVLLNEICRIICNEAGYRMAWVGYVENDKNKSIRPIAWAGFDNDYISKAKLSWSDETPFGKGPAGNAVRTGEIIFVQDFLTDPRMAPWRENAIQNGYRAGMAVPLKDRNSKVFGLLMVYYAEANIIAQEEIPLIDELAGDLAFGINTIRTRSKQKQAEQLIVKSEYKKTILNNIANIFLTVPDDKMYYEVLAILLKITQSKYGLFGFIEENGNFVVPCLTEGIWDECKIEGKTHVFPSSIWGKSLWGKAIQTKKAYSSIGPFTLPQGHIEIKYFITVPIVFGDETIGLICLANKETEYTNEEQEILQDIVKFISPILNARLQRDKQEKKRKQYELDLIQAKEIAEESEKQLFIKNKEYEALNEELSQTNEELFNAKSKAEESDRLKTAFLQNMSHEIRTPLNAISGFAGILNKPDLSEEKRKSFTSIIQNSSKQLVSIVSDILTISSLDTKQEKINIEKTCINTIIVDLLSIFKQQAQNQNISLYANQKLTDNLSEIYTDKTKITQILSNLISNAFKFTHEGFIEFGYNLKDNEIEFYVKDTGIGIKQEQQDKIFERFRQANESIQQNYGGTGLGLSISKGFVEILGGKIWVQSELEKGSTFYFTIPYKPVHEINRDTSPTKQNENRRTILVAEDEEYNFLYIEELLIDENLKLIHAKNGEETLKIFKSNPNIDLILMDIKMPIMAGDKAAKIIKELNPALPIIAQSAYALEHERAKFAEIFDEYLTKPIKQEDLKQIIRKHITKK